MPGDVRGWLRRVFYERQIFGGVRLRHQGAIFPTSQAVLDPVRILMSRDADSMIKGTTAQPTEKNVFVRELAAILTPLFS